MKLDAKKQKVCWVVTGKSESGDDSGPEVFSKEPTDKQLRKFIRDTGEELDCDGPGEFGSYVYLNIKIIKLKQ